MTSPVSFASIGECMIEFAPTENGLYRRGYAGDTLNTAWYVRALIRGEENRVRYVTALGTDAASEQMRAFLSRQVIDTSGIASIPDRTVGLYMITLTGAERSFSYWRSNSAARLLAADTGRLNAALADISFVYFSGITLAILEPADRFRLLDALEVVRQRGGTVAYDPNIRPRLWSDSATMRTAITDGYRSATIALPTFPDEADVFGDRTPLETIERIASIGVPEIVVKDGAEPCVLRAGGEIHQVPPQPVHSPVDTTGAGDSFNGGYLAGRMTGKNPMAATRLGHAVAARVIQHRGALIDMTVLSDLALI